MLIKPNPRTFAITPHQPAKPTHTPWHLKTFQTLFEYMAGWWARFGTAISGLLENLANCSWFSLIGEDILNGILGTWPIDSDLGLSEREW
jgi:hypothetical protein